MATWRCAARPAALGLAASRGLLGLAALVRPSVPARLWVRDEDAASPGGRVLARALGGRDLALALGCLLSARAGEPIRGWVEAGALADSGDLLATVAAWRSLPPARRRAVALLASGAAVLGWAAAPLVDRGTAASRAGRRPWSRLRRT